MTKRQDSVGDRDHHGISFFFFLLFPSAAPLLGPLGMYFWEINYGTLSLCCVPPRILPGDTIIDFLEND